MTRELKGRGVVFVMSLSPAIASFVAVAPAQDNAQTFACTKCAEWNVWQPPFRIYGNTYYVGPRGLTSILVSSPHGHVLIDGALAESAPAIADNIRALGFRLNDVKLILSTHVHYDHAGGIAELQKQTGAKVAASPWSAEVLSKSGIGNGDPQFNIIRRIPLVSNVSVLMDGESVSAGGTRLTAHFTPGHTPGGTTWTWRSCEGSRCFTVVYADSLAAISQDGFRFTDTSDHSHAIDDFKRSIAFLRKTDCDILLTPHPEVSELWDRLKRREEGAGWRALTNRNACRELAGHAEEQLHNRIESERQR